jgi:hypothetical protein
MTTGRRMDGQTFTDKEIQERKTALKNMAVIALVVVVVVGFLFFQRFSKAAVLTGVVGLASTHAAEKLWDKRALTRVIAMATVLFSGALTAKSPIPKSIEFTKSTILQNALPPGACVVDDPASTPLNIRNGPSDRGTTILDTLPDGKFVWPTDSNRSVRWIPIALESGGPQVGWVYRKKIQCPR